jgi:hypothetical protein
MIASLAEKPRSPFLTIKREFVDLVDGLDPALPKQVRCCAVVMFPYWTRWGDWKEPKYGSRWIYQSLRDIREDFMRFFSLQVIRQTLDWLEEQGLLSIRRNARQENGRNGQDKTHQYLLHTDRVEKALEKLYSPKKAKIRKNSSVDKAETSRISSKTSGINFKTSRFTVETHTHIPSIDSCTDSCSLLEEREEMDFAPEMEDPWEIQDEPEQDLTTSFNDKPEISQEQEVKSEDQFSAAPVTKCVEIIQNDVSELKPLPKLKSDREALLRSADRVSGFIRRRNVKAFTRNSWY